MRRVISYSWFRHKDSTYEQESAGAAQGRFFLGFMPALLRAHFSVFPDWEMHIHHDQAVTVYPYFEVLSGLWARRDNDNPKIVLERAEHTAKRLCESMLWRMKSIWWYDSPDVVLCRDIDSLPQPRERKAVEKWLASSEDIHSIHDSESHGGTRILGGTCGFKADVIRKRIPLPQWQSEIKNYDLRKHGSDQHFLNYMFPEKDWSVLHHFTKDMGPVGGVNDPRDSCNGAARCIGGAYHASPVAEWYDEHHPGLTEIIREAEKEAGV